MSADIEVIAQAHLSCRYPSHECDPVAVAIAAKVSDRDTALLVRAIEGYHDPIVRVLCAAAKRAMPSGETTAPDPEAER